MLITSILFDFFISIGFVALFAPTEVFAPDLSETHVIDNYPI